MNPSNRQILDECRIFHITLSGPAKTLKGLNSREKDLLLKAAREEFFGPNYHPDLYCPPCIAEFIMQVYGAYDKWITDNNGSTD